VKARRAKIVLPERQWASWGWAVEWRRGNDHRDRYELTYKHQYEALIVVTRAGWKWAEYNPRLSVLRQLRNPLVWSPVVFETWQGAVADYAVRYRKRWRRRSGIEVTLPQDWLAVRRDGRIHRTPWVPRPVHDDFTLYEQEKTGA
jgi:hypothetical protein